MLAANWVTFLWPIPVQQMRFDLKKKNANWRRNLKSNFVTLRSCDTHTTLVTTQFFVALMNPLLLTTLNSTSVTSCDYPFKISHSTPHDTCKTQVSKNHFLMIRVNLIGWFSKLQLSSLLSHLIFSSINNSIL